jgi:predicted alpha/beta-hydrolase family hydrolase
MSANPQDGSSRPTVVLVHGAFAESASHATKAACSCLSLREVYV